MHLLQSLSETPLGRALIAYFFDLPRWTLANLVFAVALLPAYLALLNGVLPAHFYGLAATLPVVPVLSGMIHMAGSQTAGNAPRLRSAIAYPPTLVTVFIVWMGATIFGSLLLSGMPVILLFAIAIGLLSLLMIGVFAIFLPAQLNVNGLLIWRNALVLAVSNPIVGLGMLLLAGIGGWAIAITKGALIVVVPALWVLLAAFTVGDRIQAIQSKVDGAA